ncbi:hypothetical protein Trydic_g16386 [Trypoxylus dichotomus]
MEDYEKEMHCHQALWDEMQSEDGDVIELDGESDIDNVSVNSDYPDIKQPCRLEEEQYNPSEDAGATTNIEDYSVIENVSIYIKVRARTENLICQLPGVNRSVTNKRSPLECFLKFINHEMIDQGDVKHIFILSTNI